MMDKVTYLNDWKQKKNQEENLVRGRTPLYVSHKEGKISAGDDLFGTRVAKIKSSLESINKLMSQLKAMNKEEDDE